MNGETLALVLGDKDLVGRHLMSEKQMNQPIFFHRLPPIYKKDLNTWKFEVENLTRLNKTRESYI